VNIFANVSKDLYDNATVSTTLDGETIEFDLEPGAYSLQDFELAIASNFTVFAAPAAPTTAFAAVVLASALAVAA
jgi:hypothetical protein